MLTGRPTMAMASHRSVDSLWKDDRRHLHLSASIPDGPAAPWFLSSIDQINRLSICSKMTGWGACTGASKSITADGLIGSPFGCLASNTSRTVNCSLPGTWSSKFNEPPLLCMVGQQKNSWLNLPCKHKLGKCLC